MALNAFLTLKGDVSGDIDGGSTIPGREDQIVVFGFTHSVTSPRDPASGLPTGKRAHKPFVITKDVDKASPLLLNVLVTNENLREFTLRCYRPSRTGAEEQYYTVTLENATVSDYRTEMLNNKYSENAVHQEREHISFTYQKITWTFENGGITASDDWESPVA